MMEDIKPLINFAGERVALGPLRRELNELYNRWNNDFIVNRTTASMRPVTLEEQIEAFDRFTRDKSLVLFTIYDKTTLKPIGMSYLTDINHGNAEFGIVIGETEYHRKGYGTEATEMTLDYGFTVLGLHNIMLYVYEYNKAGIAAYKKAGFKECGRRRAVKWMNGKRWDSIYMDCIASEFQSRILSKLLACD